MSRLEDLLSSLCRATDEFIDKLEARIKEIKSVTAMLEEGMTPEQILEHILGDMELEILTLFQQSFTVTVLRTE